MDFQLSVLDETGNYLHFQLVSPVWTLGKIPLGIPTFLPMEGIHSQNQKSVISEHTYIPVHSVPSQLTVAHPAAQLCLSVGLKFKALWFGCVF